MLAAGSRLVPGFHLKSDTIAGRYRVESVLGVGSTGFVVAAIHAHSRQRVALKVLTQKGARANTAVAATLTSPNIAHIVEAGLTDEGYPFVATERLEGESLAGKVFPARQAVALIRQACAALAEAHAHDLVHGDLKPQNLFLTTDGVLKILDFGMTMPLAEESEEASAAWFASPAYLAPEQLREAVAPAASDVWALGVILHQLVSGKLPFDAETIAGMFVAVAYDEPAMLSEADVPYELAKIVHQCLAKQPAQRPSVEQLSAMLAPFADRGEAKATLLGVPELAAFPDSVAPMSIDEVLPAGPITMMEAAIKKSTSRPPPLPTSRLGARPRPPRLPSRVPTAKVAANLAKGWLVARVAQTRAALRTQNDLERRRLGAVTVVAAAALLGVVSLFSSPTTTVARLEDDATVLGNQAIEMPADAAILPFVPASFALPEREEARVQPAPEATATAVLPPPRWTPRPRPRLAVREDPYVLSGFTHPSKLRDPKKR